MTIIKRIIVLLLSLAVLPGLVFAQRPSTDKMQIGATSASSEEARYTLNLVRNGYAEELNKYFDQAPWKTQAEIDVYTNMENNASVSLFCAAVDLGNIEVVKAFLDHNYGPLNLCHVKLYAEKNMLISKAEKLDGKTVGQWFPARKDRFVKIEDLTEKYNDLAVNKKEIKSYIAYPLDFASGEMFDYLWSKGFRSNNLFNKKALAEAKKLGRTDIMDYIMQNKPESLSDKPKYMSEIDYRKLLSEAQKDYNSLAYKALAGGMLNLENAATPNEVEAKKADLKKLIKRQESLLPKNGKVEVKVSLGKDSSIVANSKIGAMERQDSMEYAGLMEDYLEETSSSVKADIVKKNASLAKQQAEEKKRTEYLLKAKKEYGINEQLAIKLLEATNNNISAAKTLFSSAKDSLRTIYTCKEISVNWQGEKRNLVYDSNNGNLISHRKTPDPIVKSGEDVMVFSNLNTGVITVRSLKNGKEMFTFEKYDRFENYWGHERYYRQDRYEDVKGTITNVATCTNKKIIRNVK